MLIAVFIPLNQTNFPRIQKWLDEGSGLIIVSVDGDYINISIYHLIAGIGTGSCMKKWGIQENVKSI